MRFWHFTLLAMSLLPAVTLGAKDFSQAQQLHQEHCLTCHQTELYQNPDSVIKTLPHLRSQVLFCSVESGAEWFDEEVDEVTDYLNTFYYLFGLK